MYSLENYEYYILSCEPNVKLPILPGREKTNVLNILFGDHLPNDTFASLEEKTLIW